MRGRTNKFEKLHNTTNSSNNNSNNKRNTFTPTNTTTTTMMNEEEEQQQSGASSEKTTTVVATSSSTSIGGGGAGDELTSSSSNSKLHARVPSNVSNASSHDGMLGGINNSSKESNSNNNNHNNTNSSNGEANVSSSNNNSSSNSSNNSSSSNVLSTVANAVTGVLQPTVNINPNTPASSPMTTITSPRSGNLVAVPSSYVDPDSIPVERRKTVLLLMCILKIITSYDAGAFSFAIGADKGIAADLDLDTAQAGFLGSSVYLGNIVGCAVCAWLFHRRSAKYLLCIGMILHGVFTILFALANTFAFAIFARIGIGFTLSFVVVYSVVWADVFSPKANATLWLAMLNIGVPVGTLAGFLAGGAVVNTAVYSWRWIFFVKTFLMVPVMVFMAHVDPTLIDDPTSTAGSEAHLATPHLEVWSNFLGNRLMILNVAGLSVLYFIATAMQVFFTQYLRDPPFSASVHQIMISFGMTAVSAPIVGVAAGGFTMDKWGNYRDHPDRAADLGAVAATLAAIFGVFTTMCTSIGTLSFNLWMMLFFGAAALPSAMGLIVASVPAEQKNAASSFANIMFNVWGYFAGPMFCGFVAQHFDSLRTAMAITLNTGWIGVLFFWMGSRVAKTLKEQRDAVNALNTVSVAPGEVSAREEIGDDEEVVSGGGGGGEGELSSKVPSFEGCNNNNNATSASSGGGFDQEMANIVAVPSSPTTLLDRK